MQIRAYEAGEEFVAEGEAAHHFILILSGEIHFHSPRMEALVVVSPGTAVGVLPFSRMKTWTARGWAAQPSRAAFMDVEDLRDLVYRAPILTQHLVSQMMDRARQFTRMEEGTHRLLSLGKLSAGLAHELNNPAAAAVRSSARLRAVLAQKRQFTLSLHSEAISELAERIFTELADSIAECVGNPRGDTLEHADRESQLAEWLDSRGAPSELASGLVDAGISANVLEPLAESTSARSFSLALRVLAADYEILCLATEVEEASRRVSDLVHAVKVYSYMDRNPMSDVEVEQGIDATLRMFQHRTRLGIEVDRRFAGGLPKIRGNGGALNQIWTNLIDNALDALDEVPTTAMRRLGIRTCLEPEAILVEIADNGPGIQPDVQERMFEPFFTTKPVGDGTGLGLDIVQRIVREHRGTIRVESQPGRTVVHVRLPLEPVRSEIKL
ncbi:MAG: cyclic nucleotide-binding domain-containing protein [Bryobacteraceae bacterium]|nr:cyclic nucleotide-binding domain-containing protein [Bryobacteraceae bacterium]